MGRPDQDKLAVKPKEPKSLIWRHFGDKFDGVNAICKLCQVKDSEALIKVPDGSTKGLRKHVQTNHKAEWTDMERDEEKKAKETKTEAEKKRKRADTQPKIDKAINDLTKVDPQGARQKNYDKCLVEFLACKFIPFQVVDSPEFKNLINLLDKSINHKHSTTTYSDQVERVAKGVLQEVKEVVAKYCDVSAAITTDLWTSRARDSYISITLHFVDEYFKLHRYYTSEAV